jgi:hypothetical protein
MSGTAVLVETLAVEHTSELMLITFVRCYNYNIGTSWKNKTPKRTFFKFF